MTFTHTSGHDAFDDKEPVPSHSQHEMEAYIEHTPDHAPRSNTKLYNESHRHLTKIENIGCYICGIRNSDKPEKNLETHHWFVEDSKKTGIDWVKWGNGKANFLYNPQNGLHIGSSFDWAEVAKDPHIFTDSVFNLVVLCKKHHVGLGTGIHHVPAPLWQLQGSGLDGFEFLEAPTSGTNIKP